MRRSPITLALLPFALTCSLYGQNPASAPAGDQPVLIIKRNSSLVVLDVVVTDDKQNPVSGLKSSDFTILEKGKPQTIIDFDEHGPSEPGGPPPPMPNLPPNTFTNYKPVADNGPLNILLFDAEDTSMTDQAAVRSQMLKFLDSMPPGARIAIFSLSTQLRLVQGFTSDRELLRSALNDKKSMPIGSKRLADAVNNDQSLNQSDFVDTHASLTDLNSTATAERNAASAKDDAYEAATRATVGAHEMFDGMAALAHYLAGFPGRKNLVWFAGTFPGDLSHLFNANTQTSSQGNQDQSSSIATDSFQMELRETTDLFTQGQIAIYPVDTHGEEDNILPVFTSGISSDNKASQALMAQNGMSGNFGANYKGAETKYYNQRAMDETAQNTGGKVFTGNDIAAEIQHIVSIGSHYYTITYTPQAKWNGEYRNIEVKVGQPNLQLYYRHSYFADDPGNPTGLRAAPGVVPPSAMGTAMLPGAPEPTQIVFAAQIAPVSLTPNAAAAAGDAPGAKVRGPYIDYAVHYGLDARNIMAQVTPDDVRHGKIELTALLYDSDGSLVNSISNSVSVVLDDKILQQGLHLTQTLSVPVDPKDPKKKHDYTFRVGVHDVNGDRVGALEIPVSAIHDPGATASIPGAAAN